MTLTRFSSLVLVLLLSSHAVARARDVQERPALGTLARPAVVNTDRMDRVDLTRWIPASVEFLLFKEGLAAEIDANFDLDLVAELRKTTRGKDFVESGGYESLIKATGVEKLYGSWVKALGGAGSEFVEGYLAGQVIFAGRSGGKPQWALLMEMSEGARQSWAKDPEAASARFAQVVHTGLAEFTSDLLPEEGSGGLSVWHSGSAVVVAADAGLLAEIQELARQEDVGPDSFQATSTYGFFQREQQNDFKQGDRTEFFVLRPEELLRATGLRTPLLRQRQDPQSTFTERLLSQVVSAPFTESIVGYSRRRSEPSGAGSMRAGMRVRGRIRLKTLVSEPDDQVPRDDDSPAAVELDRHRLFSLPRDGERGSPASGTAAGIPVIERLAGIVPNDVALWSYFGGDLRALARVFERGLPPAGHPGTFWDRELINEQFRILLDGAGFKLGYNPQVKRERNFQQKEIPQRALVQAQRELVVADQERIRLRAADIEARMRAALPRVIALDPAEKGRALREILEHLAAMLGRSSGRADSNDGDQALGRAVFVMRKNDYGDLRADLDEDQRAYFPSFYDGDHVNGSSPAWAFVFWVDADQVARFEETLRILMQNLPWEAKTLRVEMVKEGVGQWYMQEYWNRLIPGPGQIVTAMVPDLEEEVEARRDGRRPKGARLFLFGNHLRLVEDLGTAAVQTHDARSRRLRDRASFRSTLREEIDQQSNLFVYVNGRELARLFDAPYLGWLESGLLSLRAVSAKPHELAFQLAGRFRPWK